MKKVMLQLMALFTGIVGGTICTEKVMKKKVDEMRHYADKHLALFLMMNQWVKVKQEGKNLAQYLDKKGYKKIAIYGMSYAGETLLEELKGTEIQIAYGIDKNVENIYSELDIFSLDDTYANVDAIVVTAITFFDEVQTMLCKKVDFPIISLEEILYEV